MRETLTHAGGIAFALSAMLLFDVPLTWQSAVTIPVGWIVGGLIIEGIRSGKGF